MPELIPLKDAFPEVLFEICRHGLSVCLRLELEKLSGGQRPSTSDDSLAHVRT
jgi:hypothetical protein